MYCILKALMYVIYIYNALGIILSINYVARLSTDKVFHPNAEYSSYNV